MKVRKKLSLPIFLFVVVAVVVALTCGIAIATEGGQPTSDDVWGGYAAMEDDGTEGMIRNWIERYQGDKVCAIQVWQEALNEEKRPPKWQATVINNILSSLPDWERVTTSMRFEHYGTQRGFRRKFRTTDFVNCDMTEEIEGMVFN